MMEQGSATESQPSAGSGEEKKEIIAKPNQVSAVVLYGIPIVSLIIEAQERLCLAQISNTLLKQFSYNEIHNRRVALGITCVQCTPVQLEILRRAGAMPVSSRRCGMISRREAERLCKSFLGDNTPPRLPEDFAFAVHHECAWGCRGSFLPSRYNSSRAKCIKCSMCGLFFSPNKFIFHSHHVSPNDKYVQPDAANFNSWRRHMKLSGNPPEEIVHAWEDVKAMFNGGTRKRLLGGSAAARGAKERKLDTGTGEVGPVVPTPAVPAALPISRVAMDFIYHKPLAFTTYSSFPWLKRGPMLFPQDGSFFEKPYQSAFKPVQPAVREVEEQSDDEVDIETTDDKNEEVAAWNLKEEKSHSGDLTTVEHEGVTSLSQRIWNLSRLSFDGDRSSFLYRQDLPRPFIVAPEPPLLQRAPIPITLKPDCSTCLSQAAIYPPEGGNKIS